VAAVEAETAALPETAMATEAVEVTRVVSTMAAAMVVLLGSLATTEGTVTTTKVTTLSREVDAPTEMPIEREKTRCEKRINTQTE